MADKGFSLLVYGCPYARSPGKSQGAFYPVPDKLLAGISVSRGGTALLHKQTAMMWANCHCQGLASNSAFSVSISTGTETCSWAISHFPWVFCQH